MFKYVNGKCVEETQEEIKQREEQQKQEKLSYSVVSEKPSKAEINLAEYILITEDKIMSIEAEIKILKGSGQ